MNQLRICLFLLLSEFEGVTVVVVPQRTKRGVSEKHGRHY